MLRQVEYCDWCEKNKPIFIVVRGNNEGIVLCEKCKDEFLEGLAYHYLEYLNNKNEESEGSANGERRNKNPHPDRSARQQEVDR